MNIYDALLNTTKEYCDKKAVICDQNSYSYGELTEYSIQIARWFEQKNITPRSNVIIYLHDSIDFVATLFGANMAGMVIVPLSPWAKDLKFQEVFEHSGAVAVITTRKLWESAGGFDGCPTPDRLLLIDESPLENGPNMQSYQPSPWDADEMTAIFYLSDSTGLPKGIMLSSRNILTNMEAIIEYLGINDQDRLLILKSMAIVGTFTGEILAGLATGSTIVVLSGTVHAGIILKAIDEYRITGFFAVPVLLHQIVDYKRKSKFRWDSLRYIQTGAAKLLQSDVEQLIAMYPGVDFYYIYGLSEASPRVLHLKPEDMLKKAGSVGTPVKYCSVKLLDADQNPTPPGQIGELYVEGPNVMLGYYKNPDLSQKVLTPHGLKTGDLAYFDEEGYTYLTGRADLMINQGGIHVYPAEIERVISKFSRIEEVKVEGIPDDLLGQKIKVTVKPKAGMGLSLFDIFEYCSAHLESSKVPKIFEIAK